LSVAVACAAALVALLTGCQVHTQVVVYQAPSGQGMVAVSVSLDASALAAIGGRQALAAQLQDADLKAAGWTVTGPEPGPGSSTVVAASHGYNTPAQAGQLVAELAGSGPLEGPGRLFRLSVEKRHSFWRNDTVLQGEVNLTCGLACFGDSGLTRALGFPTGVNPVSLAATAGERPDQVFTFSFDTRLPGRLVGSNGTRIPDGSVRWTPRLGQRLQLAALTRTWNTGHIVGASVIGGVVILVLGSATYWWVRRRRRRNHRRSHRGRGTASETLASHS
jgi:hypothetical protein